MTPHRLSVALVVLGAVLLSAAAWMVYRPAGVAVAGVALVLFGLFLVDVEAVREPGTARPLRSRR
jgi:membrane-bound ClpP family serine protease